MHNILSLSKNKKMRKIHAEIRKTYGDYGVNINITPALTMWSTKNNPMHSYLVSFSFLLWTIELWMDKN